MCNVLESIRTLILEFGFWIMKVDTLWDSQQMDFLPMTVFFVTGKRTLARLGSDRRFVIRYEINLLYAFENAPECTVPSLLRLIFKRAGYYPPTEQEYRLAAAALFRICFFSGGPDGWLLASEDDRCVKGIVNLKLLPMFGLTLLLISIQSARFASLQSHALLNKQLQQGAMSCMQPRFQFFLSGSRA